MNLKALKHIVVMLTATLIVAGIAGCSKEGPAEKAGKQVDRALEKAKKVFD